MKTFALALTATAVTAFSDVEFKFMNYIAKFGKVIENLEEFETRLAHFIKSETEIEAHNATEANFKLGHNQFSDRSHEEYSAMLGFVNLQDAPKNVVVLEEANGPSEVNWVTAGAVTGVKNRGSCGSCWSFSTTGAMEGAHYVATGELLSFSEQQLVDCATGIYLNMGCNGGNPLWAYRYLKKHYAELESEYPYTSGNGDDSTDCLYDSHSKTAVEVQASASVTSEDRDQMKAALAQQPLAVLVEADKMAFQTYQSGVLTGDACGTQLDHAVLAVGYGTEDGQDYWLVKNSWDTTWGDNGYIKLGMDDSTD